MHQTRKKYKECGYQARKAKITKMIKQRSLRNEASHSQKMRRIGPHLKNLSRPHKSGAAVSKGEKEMVLHLFDKNMGKEHSV